MEKRVNTDDVREGMYVCRLDRPWLETPFLLQGFYVMDDEDIRSLKEYCQYVYIETEAPDIKLDTSDTVNGKSPWRQTVSDLPKPTTEYQDQNTVEEEIAVVKELQLEVLSAVDEIMNNVRDDKKLDINRTKEVVSSMTDSILRNPNAFLWMRILKDKDSYTYSHCMDSGALAIAFGRHIGLSRNELEDLGMGALLSDVGKMQVPDELLNKPGELTEKEFEIVKKHVVYSVRIMQKSGGLSKAAIATAATHHERFDGSGYPRGLKGNEIPVLGRMAAIVDCYDAITSDRPHRRAISPNEAVRRLYDWRGSAFQSELVEQFIQTLGTYPTGSIVELNTGQVGIVVSQNRLRRLRPKLMLILDEGKNVYNFAPMLDLLNETQDSSGDQLEIIKVLEPGTYGIEPKDFN
ncbi:MAG: HD-GYP domain-containing protein, partial [Gammaproteobacteria bacterium]|nr:HD-GYP domain-containing protein [Gammaproteobacteria bacterium]